VILRPCVEVESKSEISFDDAFASSQHTPLYVGT
jgi:hypothetical protein